MKESGNRHSVGIQLSGELQYRSRKWGKICLDLLFPPRCPLCDEVLAKTERLVCRKCAAHLPFIRFPYCRRCGRPLDNGGERWCRNCLEKETAFKEGRCTFEYKGSMRDSVLRMKFHNRRDYLGFYAAAMAGHHRDYLKRIRADILVPIPMHPRKRRERGFDQCALLAEKFSVLTGLPVHAQILERVRETLPQKGLHLHERQKNLRDAFRVRDVSLRDRRILLLDDIFTTGSTMEEASRALCRGGAAEICFLALCSSSLAGHERETDKNR